MDSSQYRGYRFMTDIIRRWVKVFEPGLARRLRARRPKPHDRRRLDEMFVRIGGRQLYLWRAVDAEGEVLDVHVQAGRDKAAVSKLMRKLLKKYAAVPDGWVTDRYEAYSAALREIILREEEDDNTSAARCASGSPVPFPGLLEALTLSIPISSFKWSPRTENIGMS